MLRTKGCCILSKRSTSSCRVCRERPVRRREGVCSKASWNSSTVHDNEDLERDITTGWQKIQRRRGLQLKRMHEVFGQPRAGSVDTLHLIPLPTGSNNKTCQRSGLFLFLSDGTDNLLLILKLQMN